MLRQGGLRQAAKVAHYCLIALAAYAGAVVVVKAASLDLEPETSATSSAAVVDKDPVSRHLDDAIILRRNVFGAPSVESEEDSAPPVGVDDLRLRGIATAERGSFAVFENTTTGEQDVFAIGDRVFDGPKLVAVDDTGADVLLKGKKRRYEIVEDDEAELAHEGGKKKDKVGGKSEAKKGETAGVRKTGENAYLIDRREVEATIANLNEVITQARAVPVMKDGQSAGFKLFSIRPGSIFDKIGLAEGDIVQRVNDTELTDPSRAVGLLEEVQSMGEIRVNFVRGGKPLTYTYTVR